MTKIESIAINPPLQEIARRLGYPPKKELSTQEIMLITEALGLCTNQVIYEILPVTITETEVFINNKRFLSKNLAKFLANASEILLMGATVGHQITKARDQLLSHTPAQALIFDAVGSMLTPIWDISSNSKKAT